MYSAWLKNNKQKTPTVIREKITTNAQSIVQAILFLSKTANVLSCLSV